MEINIDEIIVIGFPVKYHGIEYHDDYVVITQNRTRRRVPKGYYFEDTGVNIYVSPYYAHIFQHKKTKRNFILNKETKNWRNYEPIVTIHVPDVRPSDSINPDATLTR